MTKDEKTAQDLACTIALYVTADRCAAELLEALDDRTRIRHRLSTLRCTGDCPQGFRVRAA